MDKSSYKEKMSDTVYKEKIRKATAFRRAFIGSPGETTVDLFGNKRECLDGRRIIISNNETTVRLCYGHNDYKGYIKIADVIMHKGGAFTYLAADGKTSIYVGETIEIKEN